VHGAAGGVGTLAVQIGRALGAHVTAVASGRHATLLHDLGADEVLDRHAVSVPQLGRRFDVALDCVDTLSTRELRRLLVAGGTAVSVNPGRGLVSPVMSALHGRRRVRPVLVAPSGEDLRTLAAMVDDGALRPVVERQVPLADLAAAQRENALGRAQGKTVVVVDPRLATLVPAGVHG
jgi:NADPH:quinone reductase-like Zn-dependent oxidoreductase